MAAAGIGLVEGYRVRNDRRGHLLEVAASSHRPDDGRASPMRELRRQRPDTTEHAVHQDGPPADRAIGEHGPVGGDPGDTEARADLVADVVGEVDACCSGTTVNCAAVPKGR